MQQISIQEKIDCIISTFHSAQSITENTSYEDLHHKLMAFKPEFRSVAFEAASMSILYSELKNNSNNPTNQWHNFFNSYRSNHKTQLLLGFGWALAALDKNPADFLNQFDPILGMRILDGYGYYHGILRARRSVQNIQVPEYITNDLLFAFDQGLGRSLWYLSKGDLEKLKELLSKFPTHRKENLWRGIGTAAAYIGGISADVYKELNQLAEENGKQFILGIIFAVRTRMLSDSITGYIEDACKTLTHFNVNTAFNFTEESKQKASSFKEWVSIMSEAI